MVTWEVDGKPELFFHESDIPGEPHDEVTGKYLDFILAVCKGSKEVRQKIQVVILPDSSSTEIVFPITLRGDTLIAAGVKNPVRWGSSFKVTDVSFKLARSVWILHAGKTAELNPANNSSAALNGTPIEGPWEILSLLTPQEKRDMSTAPESFRITASIHYKR
jgi:hypothetical protein